jgi:hypothetical protein
VYRKLRDGWTEIEIIANRKGATAAVPEGVVLPETPPPAPIPTVEPSDELHAVEWARAVLWAADNVDHNKKRMSKTKAGSAMRYNMFLFGKENGKELMVNLVPKALNILDKNKNPDGGEITEAEERGAGELLGILKQALEESNRQWVERN